MADTETRKRKADAELDDEINTKNLDKELELDTDPFAEGGVEDNGGRKPTSATKQVVIAGLKGLKAGAAQGISDELHKQVPSLHEMASEITETYQEFKELKDELANQLQPIFTSLEDTTRKVLPKAQGLLPKKLYDKLHKKLDERDKERKAMAYTPKSREQMQDESIADELAKIFAAQQKSQAESALEQERVHLTNMVVEAARHKKTSKSLVHIYDSLRSTELFHRTIHTAYLKKSLELKYKHLYVARDTYNLLSLSMKSFESYYKALVKNTMLPDMAKIQMGDYHRQRITKQYGDRMADYMGKLRSSMIDRVKKGVKSAVQNLGMAATMASGAADMSEGFGEEDPNMATKAIASLIGNITGYFGGGPGAKAVLGRVGHALTHIDKTVEGAKSEIALKAIDLKNKWAMGSLPQQILASFIPEFNKGQRASNALLEKPDDAVPFDVLTKQSIVEIIPGYLGKILKELETTRTGEPAPDRTYNVFERRFTTAEDLKADVNKRLYGDESTRRSNLKNSLRTLAAGIKMKDEKADVEALIKPYRKDIHRFAVNHAVFRESLKPKLLMDYVQNKGAYDGGYDVYIKTVTTGFENDPVEVIKVILSGLTDTEGKLSSGLVAEFKSSLTGFRINDRYVTMLPKLFETYGYRDIFSNKFSTREQKQFDQDISAGNKAAATLKEKGGTLSAEERAKLEKLVKSGKNSEAVRKRLSGLVDTENNINLADIAAMQADVSMDDFELGDINDKIAELQTIERGRAALRGLATRTGIAGAYRAAKDVGSSISGSVGDFLDGTSGLGPMKKMMSKMIGSSANFKAIDEFVRNVKGGKALGENLNIEQLKSALPDIRSLADVDPARARKLLENLQDSCGEYLPDDIKREINALHDKATGEQRLDMRDVLSSVKGIATSRLQETATKMGIDTTSFGAAAASVGAKVAGAAADIGVTPVSPMSTGAGPDLTIVKTFQDLYAKNSAEQLGLLKTWSQKVNEDHDALFSATSWISNILRNMPPAIASGSKEPLPGPETTDKGYANYLKRKRIIFGAARGIKSGALKIGRFYRDTYHKVIDGVSGIGKAALGKDGFLSKLAEMGKTGVEKLPNILELLGGGLKNIGKGYVQTWGKAIDAVGGVGKSVAEGLFGRKAERYVDIYRKDEVGKGPLVTRRQQMTDGVFYFKTGERVERSSDIHEKVMDKDKNVLINDEDIQHGLVNVDNQPVGSGGTQGLIGAAIGAVRKMGPGLGKAVGSIADLYKHVYSSLFDLGVKGVKGAAKGAGTIAARIFGYDVAGSNKKMLELLGQIQGDVAIVAARFKKKAHDLDGDGDIEGTYEDQMQKKAAAAGGGKEKGRTGKHVGGGGRGGTPGSGTPGVGGGGSDDDDDGYFEDMEKWELGKKIANKISKSRWFRKLKVGKWLAGKKLKKAGVGLLTKSKGWAVGAKHGIKSYLARRGGNDAGKGLKSLFKFGGKAGAAKGVARAAGKWAGPLAALTELGIGGYDAVKAYSAGDNKAGTKAVGGALGGAGGALGGAALGASIGSVIPGLGTAVGGVLGGIIGSMAGSGAGKWIGGGVHEALGLDSDPMKPNEVKASRTKLLALAKKGGPAGKTAQKALERFEDAVKDGDWRRAREIAGAEKKGIFSKLFTNSKGDMKWGTIAGTVVGGLALGPLGLLLGGAVGSVFNKKDPNAPMTEAEVKKEQDRLLKLSQSGNKIAGKVLREFNDAVAEQDWKKARALCGKQVQSNLAKLGSATVSTVKWAARIGTLGLSMLFETSDSRPMTEKEINDFTKRMTYASKKGDSMAARKLERFQTAIAKEDWELARKISKMPHHMAIVRAAKYVWSGLFGNDDDAMSEQEISKFRDSMGRKIKMGGAVGNAAQKKLDAFEDAVSAGKWRRARNIAGAPDDGLMQKVAGGIGYGVSNAWRFFFGGDGMPMDEGEIAKAEKQFQFDIQDKKKGAEKRLEKFQDYVKDEKWDKARALAKMPYDNVVKRVSRWAIGGLFGDDKSAMSESEIQKFQGILEQKVKDNPNDEKAKVLMEEFNKAVNSENWEKARVLSQTKDWGLVGKAARAINPFGWFSNDYEDCMEKREELEEKLFDGDTDEITSSMIEKGLTEFDTLVRRQKYSEAMDLANDLLSMKPRALATKRGLKSDLYEKMMKRGEDLGKKIQKKIDEEKGFFPTIRKFKLLGLASDLDSNISNWTEDYLDKINERLVDIAGPEDENLDKIGKPSADLVKKGEALLKAIDAAKGKLSWWTSPVDKMKLATLHSEVESQPDTWDEDQIAAWQNRLKDIDKEYDPNAKEKEPDSKGSDAGKKGTSYSDKKDVFKIAGEEVGTTLSAKQIATIDAALAMGNPLTMYPKNVQDMYTAAKGGKSAQAPVTTAVPPAAQAAPDTPAGKAQAAATQQSMITDPMAFKSNYVKQYVNDNTPAVTMKNVGADETARKDKVAEVAKVPSGTGSRIKRIRSERARKALEQARSGFQFYKGTPNASETDEVLDDGTRRHTEKFEGRKIAGQWLGDKLTPQQYQFIKSMKNSPMGDGFTQDADLMAKYALAEKGEFREYTDEEKAKIEERERRAAARKARLEELKKTDPKKYEEEMEMENFATGGFATQATNSMDANGKAIQYGEAGTEAILPLHNRPGNLLDRLGNKVRGILSGQPVGPMSDRPNGADASVHAGDPSSEPMTNFLAAQLAGSIKGASDRFATGGFASSDPALQLAVNLIAKYEGFKPEVYICPAGKKTIGFGFTDKASIAKGRMTKAEAMIILKSKVSKILNYLDGQVPGLSTQQRAALCSFIFNVGNANFESSTLKKKLLAGDFAGAQMEFGRWIYAKGKKLDGLVNRRAEEASVFGQGGGMMLASAGRKGRKMFASGGFTSNDQYDADNFNELNLWERLSEYDNYRQQRKSINEKIAENGSLATKLKGFLGMSHDDGTMYDTEGNATTIERQLADLDKERESDTFEQSGVIHHQIGGKTWINKLKRIRSDEEFEQLAKQYRILKWKNTHPGQPLPEDGKFASGGFLERPKSVEADVNMSAQVMQAQAAAPRSTSVPQPAGLSGDATAKYDMLIAQNQKIYELLAAIITKSGIKIEGFDKLVDVDTAIAQGVAMGGKGATVINNTTVADGGPASGGFDMRKQQA